jgi:hypothetical protein
MSSSDPWRTFLLWRKPSLGTRCVTRNTTYTLHTHHLLYFAYLIRLIKRQAAESITKVAAVLNQQQIEQYYIPLLERLSRGEWFTSRTSSAALYAPVYAKVSPTIQENLRKGYAVLASDDTPMVRRAAAKWLGVRLVSSLTIPNV